MSDPRTFSIGHASLRMIIAGLYLLADHAHDGWDNPAVLEVGEQFSHLEAPTEAEILLLASILAES